MEINPDRLDIAKPIYLKKNRIERLTVRQSANEIFRGMVFADGRVSALSISIAKKYVVRIDAAISRA